MKTPYDILVEFVAEAGISTQEADQAIKACAREMAKNGIAAYTAGGVISIFMNATPASAASYAITAAAFGSGSTLLFKPQCREVRSALQFWKRGDFSKLQLSK